MQPRSRWILPPADAALDADAALLARDLQLHPVLARVLCRRGHRDRAAATRLLQPHLDDLLDPLLMTDMDRASERLARALQAGEHIVISGDYDTDGITGTALLVSELRRLQGRVDFFIPDRERDGYGMTPRLVQRAGEVGVRVLISVDCGSSEHETIALAQSLGIDVIVVDHHEIPRRPAAALAVLNPKRADCAYPFKGLSAVGVAYKLLQAVCMRLLAQRTPEDGLDLVALGTMGDVQPLLQENRVLTKLGLDRLRSGQVRLGMRALFGTAGVREVEVKSRPVGFRLVPRLNAAGRVARGKLAVDLLLATEEETARRLALELETQNERRRRLTEQVEAEAREQAAALWQRAPRPALVLLSQTWHPGVVGIAAARLAEEYGVPAVLIGVQNGVGKGSIRTSGGVNVRAALDAAAAELVRFGGHKEACGLTLEPGRFEAFRGLFEDAVAQQQGEAQGRVLAVDAEITPADVAVELADALELLEPFGPGNPEPFLLVRDVRVRERTRLVGGSHLKLDLELADGSPLDGIAFRWGREISPAEVVGRHRDVVGQLRRQDPRWGQACQLVVADLREAEASDIAVAGAGEPARNESS